MDHQVRDAMGERVGLAGAGAGEISSGPAVKPLSGSGSPCVTALRCAALSFSRCAVVGMARRLYPSPRGTRATAPDARTAPRVTMHAHETRQPDHAVHRPRHPRHHRPGRAAQRASDRARGRAPSGRRGRRGARCRAARVPAAPVSLRRRGWLWELPAGKLEPDEPPLGTAQRELAEEAGVDARRWREPRHVPLLARECSPKCCTFPRDRNHAGAPRRTSAPK